jgi:16S rRNA (adenine1518-N6/adenine1519-N6)-dimethyltransferase
VSKGGGSLPPVRKSLGQHFLSDRGILTRIADAVQIEPHDTVVEIGPGRGALTDILRERAGRVIAIEYDRALATLLRERYAHDGRVRIVEADVLETDLGALAQGDFLLVGNVPYYITTPILFHALKQPRPRRAVYLVQREVGDRIAAAPASGAYGALSVNVQALARAEKVFRVAPGSFNPPPKVESVVVRITPRDDPVVRAAEEEGFREFVLAAFGFRRKQMRRVLRELRPMANERADDLLRSAGIGAEVRPETLTPEQFAALFRLLDADASRGS